MRPSRCPTEREDPLVAQLGSNQDPSQLREYRPNILQLRLDIWAKTGVEQEADAWGEYPMPTSAR